MSDEFRKRMDKKVGKGGVTCYCCNQYKGEKKPILDRLVRRAMKHDLNKAVNFDSNSEKEDNS